MKSRGFDSLGILADLNRQIDERRYNCYTTEQFAYVCKL